MFVTNVGLAVLLATCFAVSAAPHILLLVLDDIGRADTGIHGKSNINLPHLKSLASNGVVFDNFYTQTVCSPTRSSLLTGQYPFRFGMQHFTTQLPGMAAGVPLSLPMLPELLAKKGYERHMIGKWHCGYATWSHTPSKRGFQTYTGYLQAQGDYFKHTFALDQMAAPAQAVDGLDFWHNVRPMFESKGNYSLDIYRDAMTKTLRGYASRQDTAEKRAEHPLFVYLAHQTVHIPLQFRQKEDRCNKIKHATRKIYCYMLIEMDDAIGEMVEEYKSLGMWDDLLILTLTDNGGMVNYAQDKTVAEDSTSPKFPASQGSNYPFRGSKTTMFEGGVRSMAFASGGIIPKDARGRKFSGLAHVVDFSATILSFAGIYPLHKETLRLDGFDLTNVIMNHKGAIEQRDHVPINVVLKGKRYSAVRFGQYKLIVDDFMFPLAQGWFDQDGNLKEAAGTRNEGYMLFDLKDDPEERKDIAAKSPKLVQYGKDLIDMYVKGGSYMEPQNSRRWFPRALPLFHGGAWKPFMSEHKWNEIYAKDTEEIQSALLKEEDDPRIMDVNAILNGPLEIVELDAKDWAPSSGSSAAVEERQTVKKEEGNEQVSSVTPADLGESYDEAIVSVKRMRRRLGD